ncbi:hypothetical protein [Chromobacterium sp. ASV23]|uniref:hypothetical protein n=1 Tax=Chromobacterium sp. ASV23 TaxID=2795110 RepID=UPI001E2B4403|nr:hypothetical protein [Chromobacterium sp. ASV23]
MKMTKSLKVTAVLLVPMLALTGCNEQPAQMVNADGQPVAQQQDSGVGSMLLSGGAGALLGYMMGKSSGRKEAYQARPPQYDRHTIIEKRVVVQQPSPAMQPRPIVSRPAAIPSRPLVSRPSFGRSSTPSFSSSRPSFSSRRR